MNKIFVLFEFRVFVVLFYSLQSAFDLFSNLSQKLKALRLLSHGIRYKFL